MNKRQNLARLAASAIVGGLALAATPAVHAQTEASGTGKPRSSNERNVTEQVTPPPVNSDYRKAAEGQLPATGTGTTPKAATGTPSPRGAVDPATTLPPGSGRVPAMDPAARLQPGMSLTSGRAGALAVPAGLDVAMLIEHAVGMAIEGSALRSIGEQAGPDGGDPAKMLLDHARKEMAESKELLTAAAADGRGVEAASPTRRFHAAANNYMTTLGQLGSKPSPTDRAQVALINHAVKEVLDSGHIRQFGRTYAGSVATERLLGHAAMMNDEGMQTIARAASAGSPEATRLAQQARDLVDAAQQLSALSVPTAGPATNPAGGLPTGPNPGRLQDTRPEIIGGTQATGSPTTGTATPAAAAAARNVPSSAGGASGTGTTNTPPTNSNAGSRPR